jgi:low temperature requirement protein LtrA
VTGAPDQATEVPDKATGVCDPAAEAAARERRTSPVELLWDLVFAFAVTQVVTLLAHHPTWAGFGRSMLALALVWWAWSAFVWVANAFDDEAPELRLVLLLAMGFIFVAGLALPRAFEQRGTLFAVTYTVVRLLHLALYAHASRRGRAQWSAIAGFAITVAVGMALLIAGSFLSLGPRTALWLVAAAIDYAGPAWLTRERLRGLQRVAVAHFAERYSLFVIICLGESIVAIGAQASSALTAHVLVIFSLCVLATVGLWWTYFDELAKAAEERLRVHGDPVLAAADAYSYIHLVIVAGIIVFAVGAKLDIAGTGPGGLALCAGVGIYLVGHAAFAWRMLGTVEWSLLAVAIVLFVLCPFADGLPGWDAAAIVAALLGGLCVGRPMMRR